VDPTVGGTKSPNARDAMRRADARAVPVASDDDVSVALVAGVVLLVLLALACMHACRESAEDAVQVRVATVAPASIFNRDGP
jgi:hypothetical protein